MAMPLMAVAFITVVVAVVRMVRMPMTVAVLVHAPVAVVVAVIAQLRGSRMNGCLVVVAIGIVRHIARRLAGRLDGAPGVAVAVAVAVSVKGEVPRHFIGAHVGRRAHDARIQVDVEIEAVVVGQLGGARIDAGRAGGQMQVVVGIAGDVIRSVRVHEQRVDIDVAAQICYGAAACDAGNPPRQVGVADGYRAIVARIFDLMVAVLPEDRVGSEDLFAGIDSYPTNLVQHRSCPGSPGSCCRVRSPMPP